MPRNSKIETANDSVNRSIDELATKAFSSAYQRALNSENGVCAVVGGVLYRIYADGTKKRIKRVAKRIKAEPNKVYTLRA